MKSDPKVVEYLNKALTNELTAINQYWLHYRTLHHWGVRKLADYERHESIDEMKHADVLAERVLFLDGLPNFQAIHKLKVGETVEEILKADLAMEMEAASRCYATFCQAGGVRTRVFSDRPILISPDAMPVFSELV